MISLRTENSRILVENLALKRFNEKLIIENRALRREKELHLEIDQLAISPLGCPTVPNIDIFSRTLQGAFSTDINNNKKTTADATSAATQFTEKTSFDRELDEITEYLEQDNARTLEREKRRQAKSKND